MDIHTNMPRLTARPAPLGSTTSSRPSRIAARWMISFAGFPLGGLAAMLLAGPVDDLPAALLGGLITGTVLGAVQAWALGRRGRSAGHWTAATAVGLALGLSVGAATVGYATTASALVVQGALSGFGVGAAQALLLRGHWGGRGAGWPVLLGLIWAAGWAITTAIGVRVSDQFTVFGSSGALVVTALTAVLPVALSRFGTSPR